MCRVHVVPWVLLLLVLKSPVTFAHDIWLVPNRFHIAPGESLIVHQFVGHELSVEADIELLRTITSRFEMFTAEGMVDLLSELPDFRTRPVVHPVMERRMDLEGMVLIAMDHAPIEQEFSSDTFSQYVREEEFALDELGKKIAEKEKQTERYERSSKCLVRVGSGKEGDTHKRLVGQKLEILLLQNPHTLPHDQPLEVQVIFDRRPVNGQMVIALNGDGKKLVSFLKARTDSNGVARFKLQQTGFWLVRLVYLRPSDDPDVDWLSYWSTYSFTRD